MMTRFSARAWSTALIDFSRDSDLGTMMNGKITRSLSGSTGRTSGILIASSFAVSFASVLSASSGQAAMAVPASFQFGQLFYEGIHICESSRDESEADRRHRGERPRALHHHLPDALAGELALPGVEHRHLDRVGQA